MSFSTLATRTIHVRAASTANVNIATGLVNGATLDGVTLATGDRVLCRLQSDPVQNGVYTVAASGAAARSSVMQAGSSMPGQLIYVREGTASGGTYYAQTDPTGTVGTSSLAFEGLGSSLSSSPLGTAYYLKNDAVGTGTAFATAAAVSGYTAERVNWDAATQDSIGITMTNGVFTLPARKMTVKCSIAPTRTTGSTHEFRLVEISGGVSTILQGAKIGQDIASTLSPLPSGHLNYTFTPDPAKLYAIEVVTSWAANARNSTNRLNWIQFVEEPEATLVDPGLVPVTPLHRATMRRTNSTTLSTITAGATFTYDTADAANTGITTNPATGTMTATQAGVYDLDAQVFARAITTSNQQIGAYVNGTLVLSGATTAPTTASTTSDVVWLKGQLTLAANDVVTIRVITGNGDNWLSGHFSLVQLPTATLVDPGMVTPTTLRSFRAVVSGGGSVGLNTDVTFDTNFDDSGGAITRSGASITVPAGRWQIDYSAVGYGWSDTTTGFGTYRIVDASNVPFDALGSTRSAPPTATNNSISYSPTAGGVVTFSSPTTIKMRCTQGTGTHSLDDGGRVFVQITEMPTATVVDPGTVTPTTLRSFRAYASGSIAGVGNGTDVAWNADIDNSAGAITRSGASITVPAGRWEISHAVTGFSFSDTTGGSGNFQVVNAANVPFTELGYTQTLPLTYTAVNQTISPFASGVVTLGAPTVIKLRCVGGSGTHAIDNAGRSFIQITELPTGTIISPGDTPVNDQAASKYIDIGDVRMQWGQLANTTDSAQVVTFPAPFANTAYAVTMAPDDGWTTGAGEVTPWKWSGKTSTGFNIDRDDDVTGTALIDWIAIGVKP